MLLPGGRGFLRTKATLGGSLARPQSVLFLTNFVQADDIVVRDADSLRKRMASTAWIPVDGFECNQAGSLFYGCIRNGPSNLLCNKLNRFSKAFSPCGFVVFRFRKQPSSNNQVAVLLLNDCRERFL